MRITKDCVSAHSGYEAPDYGYKPPHERQVGGSHYKDLPIQPSEFIRKNGLGWYEGNIIKYTCRYKQKNGAEDIRKVIHYAELLLEELERGA
jgi:hypothetical protein